MSRTVKRNDTQASRGRADEPMVPNQSQPRCICHDDHRPAEGDVLRLFGALRDSCPALRLLVPDDLWPDFTARDEQGDPDAAHRSICLLALERGHLRSITGPIHRFLLEGNQPRKDLRAQYVQDLRERWMFADDPLERHHRSRIFMGRIVELQCAGWLEDQGWLITGLEALRPSSDIEASRDGQPYAFEVKAIGRQDEAFEVMLKSLRNEGASRWTSLDAAANYLLFRTYECGKQLLDRQTRRVAVLAIEQLAWHDFRFQLQEGWINWAQPQFLGNDSDWNDFLMSQDARYPAIRKELESVVTSLDEVWVVQRLSAYECRLEMTITPQAAAAEIRPLDRGGGR